MFIRNISVTKTVKNQTCQFMLYLTVSQNILSKRVHSKNQY